MQIVAMSILNMQSQLTRGGPPAQNLDERLTTIYHWKVSVLQNVRHSLGLDKSCDEPAGSIHS
jgi:hypothetical protein